MSRLNNLINSSLSYFKPLIPGGDQLSTEDLRELLEEFIGHDYLDRLQLLDSDLDPDTVQTIMKNASSSSLGKLGPYYELMFKITRDSRIGGMIEKRTEAVNRIMWEVESGDSDNTKANEASELLTKWIESIRFKNLLSSGIDGKLYGVKGYENVIFRSGDKYILEDPTAENEISQSRWGQGTSTKPEVSDDRWGKLYLLNKNGKGEREKLYIDDPDLVNPFKITPLIYKNKRGFYDTTGILDRVTKLYVIKIYAVRFWIRFAERYGKPFVYAKLTEKNFKDKKFKGIIRKLLMNLGSERWGIFPTDMDLESLDTNSRASTDLYKSLIDWTNIETAITILGQNLSTEVQSGSYASASVHADVEKNKTESDLEWLEEEFNDKFAYILTRLNFPDLDPEDYPKLRLEFVRNINLAEEARGLSKASKLVDIPEEEIYRRLQIRKPSVNEDAPENATGAEKYSEPVIGPSNPPRTSRFSQITEGLS